MNPYNCTRPGNLFVGYESLLREVQTDLCNGKSFAVLGGRRCGKTSLLLQIGKELRSAGLPHRGAVPCFVDIQSLGEVTPGGLFKAFYEQIVHGLDAPAFPGAESGTEYQHFLRMLDLAKPMVERAHGANWLAVLLVDELDAAVSKLPDDQFFQNLRNLLMVSRFNDHLRMIATGVKEMARLISSGSSPLNNLCHLYLRILTEEEAGRLIAHGFPDGISHQTRVALEGATGRHPYLVQGLLEKLRKQASPPDQEAVKRAAQEWLREHKDFRRWLDGFGPGERAVYRILAGAPSNSLRCDQIRKQLKPELIKEQEEGLTTLSFHGLIDDGDPEAPRVAGTMFRDWFLENAGAESEPSERNKELLLSLLAEPGSGDALGESVRTVSTRGEFQRLKIPDHALEGSEPIGTGNYGSVWLARTLIGGHRAVKIVQRNMFDHERPFAREFEGMKNYEPISRTHPGLVQILQVGLNEEEQYFYYVMEAADDQFRGRQIESGSYSPLTLAHILAERGKLAIGECVKLGTALADALGYLHEKKLIHRDIKPANIIFVNEAPKLADIGLVTELQSRAGEVTWIGTEGYIPPEGPGTAAADVYSLGKVLYQMSTGLDRRSFPTLPSEEIEPSESAAFKQFNEIVLKACENDWKRRYENGTELHADLKLLQDILGKAHASESPKSFWERLKAMF